MQKKWLSSNLMGCCPRHYGQDWCDWDYQANQWLLQIVNGTGSSKLNALHWYNLSFLVFFSAANFHMKGKKSGMCSLLWNKLESVVVVLWRQGSVHISMEMTEKGLAAVPVTMEGKRCLEHAMEISDLGMTNKSCAMWQERRKQSLERELTLPVYITSAEKRKKCTGWPSWISWWSSEMEKCYYQSPLENFYSQQNLAWKYIYTLTEWRREKNFFQCFAVLCRVQIPTWFIQISYSVCLVSWFPVDVFCPEFDLCIFQNGTWTWCILM